MREQAIKDAIRDGINQSRSGYEQHVNEFTAANEVLASLQAEGFAVYDTRTHVVVPVDGLDQFYEEAIRYIPSGEFDAYEELSRAENAIHKTLDEYDTRVGRNWPRPRYT